MTFTGNEDHSITLELASEWTANYRTANPDAIIAHAFGKSAITEIMAQEDCVAIRIYYALDDAGVKQLVICGVNADGDDLYEGNLAERSFYCPPHCGSANPLNTL